MQFSLISQAALLALLPAVLATPIVRSEEPASAALYNGTITTNEPAALLEKRGCSRSNSATHCQGTAGINPSDAQAALRDLLSQCSNGNLPGGAKRVASGSVNGVVAYACNGFCRT